jgi:hypothetical protein
LVETLLGDEVHDRAGTTIAHLEAQTIALLGAEPGAAALEGRLEDLIVAVVEVADGCVAVVEGLLLDALQPHTSVWKS